MSKKEHDNFQFKFKVFIIILLLLNLIVFLVEKNNSKSSDNISFLKDYLLHFLFGIIAFYFGFRLIVQSYLNGRK